MTREELGEHMAHMVWESLSDLLVSDDSRRLFDELGLSMTEGMPDDRASEELLVFLLWAHARALRQAFHRRSDPEPLHCVLGALHRAVYQDLEAHGFTSSNLPVFEQRVSARYFDYHHALEDSPEALGVAAALHLGAGQSTPEAVRILAARAQEIFQPLQDFLEEVEIIPPGSPTR